MFKNLLLYNLNVFWEYSNHINQFSLEKYFSRYYRIVYCYHDYHLYRNETVEPLTSCLSCYCMKNELHIHCNNVATVRNCNNSSANWLTFWYIQLFFRLFTIIFSFSNIDFINLYILRRPILVSPDSINLHLIYCICNISNFSSCWSGIINHRFNKWVATMIFPWVAMTTIFLWMLGRLLNLFNS